MFSLPNQAQFIGNVISTVANATITFQTMDDNIVLSLDYDVDGNPIIPSSEYETITLSCYLKQASLSGAILETPPGIDLETVYFEGRLINPTTYPMPIQAQGDILVTVNGQTGRVMAHRAFTSPYGVAYGYESVMGQKIAIFAQFQQGMASVS